MPRKNTIGFSNENYHDADERLDKLIERLRQRLPLKQLIDLLELKADQLREEED